MLHPPLSDRRSGFWLSALVSCFILAMGLSPPLFAATIPDLAPLTESPLPPQHPLYIGPIPGLTTTWHKAPESTSIPLGTTLYFSFRMNPGATIEWVGATEVMNDGIWSVAECPMNTPGAHRVQAHQVRIDGQHLVKHCTLEAVAVNPEEIRISTPRLSVRPIVLHPREVNGDTTRQFFAGSIARLVRLAPDRYRTSLNRPVTLDVEVSPAGFSPLIEWRHPLGGPGVQAQLGASVEARFHRPGTHPIWVGPPGAAQRIYLETYDVRITSHVSGVDTIRDGWTVTFTAQTQPPGLEEDITWLASTLYGTASPTTGRGPTFTARFKDTFGGRDLLTGEPHQWLGVRADNAIFNQDAKFRPVHHNVNIRRSCPAGGPLIPNFDCDNDGAVDDDLIDEMIDTAGNRVRLCCLSQGQYVLYFIPQGQPPQYIGQCSFPWGLNAGWKESITGEFTEITWYNMEGVIAGTNRLHDSDGDGREDRYCYIYTVKDDNLALRCEDRATGPGGELDPDQPWQLRNQTGQSPAPGTLGELNQLLFSIQGTIAPEQRNDPNTSGLRFAGTIGGGGSVTITINGVPSLVPTEPFMTLPDLVARLRHAFTEQWQQGGQQQQQQGKSAFVFDPATLGIRNALPEEIAVDVVDEPDLTFEREILPTPEGEVLALEFSQIDLNLDGNTQANSDWGSVDLTFIGAEALRYVNLFINGVWRVRNLPVLDVEGAGIAQTVTINFGLGNTPGDRVEAIDYAFDFSTAVLDEPPQETLTALVSRRTVEIDQGEFGEALDLTAGQIVVGGAAIATESGFNHGVPNQEVDVNECVPGAISNSLMFLRQRHGLNLQPEDVTLERMREATGWMPGGAPTAPTPWWDLKDAFLQTHGYPVTTTTTMDFAEAIQALRDDCDVEIRVPGHAAVVTSIIALSNGEFAIGVHHDTMQGKVGGTKWELLLYNPATGKLWDGMGFDQKPFDRFVIECPTP